MDASNFAKLTFVKNVIQDEYDILYSTLKEKYAKTLIENWSECTDPHKFVHEDLGIAAYLLLIWKDQAPCTFVDLGCGNGLLVYILTEEGHHGKGLDVRKRQIWNTYPESTVLLEETIIPSEASIYPDADWLIGNHSDELTVWLPIMAARSNSSCQFFTIPCCPYKLNGDKYQRRKANLSVYQDFLNYVNEVGEICGFEMSAEKLRIPSTKRICLIGRRKQNSTNDDVIVNLIETECKNGISGETTMWVNNFKPRSAVEPVRNCSQIPKDIQTSIMLAVQDLLLSTPRLVSTSTGHWNRGGQVPISQIATSLHPDLLQKLRSECKGLQTLMKNHHQVFQVRSGLVELRCPESLLVNSDSVKQRKDYKWKQKQCWFHDHHPNGCPLIEDSCSYTHIKHQGGLVT